MFVSGVSCTSRSGSIVKTVVGKKAVELTFLLYFFCVLSSLRFSFPLDQRFSIQCQGMGEDISQVSCFCLPLTFLYTIYLVLSPQLPSSLMGSSPRYTVLLWSTSAGGHLAPKATCSLVFAVFIHPDVNSGSALKL